jgi:hypothetical protein
MQGTTNPQLNIDLKNTTPVTTPSGTVIWKQGVLLRKVSKFAAGTDKDALLPIPVFYDAETGKLLEGTVPEDLREELKNEIIQEK